MRIKLIYILIFSLLLGKNLFSQQYYPMVKDSAVWNITNVNYAQNPWEQDYYYTHRYGIFGDTMINSIIYKKIYSIQCYCNYFDSSSSTYFGAIREDSSRKVYFINDSMEYLQYDFLLNVGDTFHYTTSWLQEVDLIVNSVDTIQINGENRRRFYLWPEQFGWTHPWIEGIGSTASLIDYVYPFGTFDVYLSCYFEKFVLVYSQIEDCCQGITDIEESFIDKKIILVYPNPACDYLNIKFETAEMKYIEIYDIQNRLIQMIKTSEKIISLVVKDYSKGVYIVKIINDNNVDSKKIIIM